MSLQILESHGQTFLHNEKKKTIALDADQTHPPYSIELFLHFCQKSICWTCVQQQAYS